MLDLPCLREGERFEQLVQSPEPPREDHEAARVFDEHVLAHEEVTELDTEVDVVVELLLVGQLDVAAHGQAAGLLATSVDRFHHPGPASGDDRKPAAGEGGAKLTAVCVVRVGWLRAGRTEYRHRRTDVVEGIEALDE